MTIEQVRSFSPQAPGELVGEFPVLTPEQITATTASARRAQAHWWAMGAAARSRALQGAAQTLHERRSEAVALTVREVGKPLAEAEGEVSRGIAILQYYSQACLTGTGTTYPPSLGGVLFAERRPRGVAGLITPWNFPIAIPLWKAAPALACGNAVLLKPSPDAVACAMLLEQILREHLPADLFTVVPGGPEAGSAVITGADVVSFTGSASVGREVAVQAARRGTAAQCEMGGQNAAVVLADADPQSAATMIAGAAMAYAGQKCTATRRVIVVGDQPAFVDALVAVITAAPASDPADPSCVVGPVINAMARTRMQAAVQSAAGLGVVLTGGSAPDRDGWFVEPTIIAGLPHEHPLWREETFGPLAVITHVDTVARAVELANSVRYGLVTSIHGRDVNALLGAADHVDTGLVKINAATTGVDYYAPSGGEKDSSYGPREQGTAALDFYSSTRTVTLAAG